MAKSKAGLARRSPALSAMSRKQRNIIQCAISLHTILHPPQDTVIYHREIKSLLHNVIASWGFFNSASPTTAAQVEKDAIREGHRDYKRLTTTKRYMENPLQTIMTCAQQHAGFLTTKQAGVDKKALRQMKSWTREVLENIRAKYAQQDDQQDTPVLAKTFLEKLGKRIRKVIKHAVALQMIITGSPDIDVQMGAVQRLFHDFIWPHGLLEPLSDTEALAAMDEAFTEAWAPYQSRTHGPAYMKNPAMNQRVAADSRAKDFHSLIGNDALSAPLRSWLAESLRYIYGKYKVSNSYVDYVAQNDDPTADNLLALQSADARHVEDDNDADDQDSDEHEQDYGPKDELDDATHNRKIASNESFDFSNGYGSNSPKWRDTGTPNHLRNGRHVWRRQGYTEHPSLDAAPGPTEHDSQSSAGQTELQGILTGPEFEVEEADEPMSPMQIPKAITWPGYPATSPIPDPFLQQSFAALSHVRPAVDASMQTLQLHESLPHHDITSQMTTAIPHNRTEYRIPEGDASSGSDSEDIWYNALERSQSGENKLPEISKPRIKGQHDTAAGVDANINVHEHECRPIQNALPAKPPQAAFAIRMMAKMGHRPGQGLGKSGEGITDPIQVQLRPRYVGVGHVNEQHYHARLPQQHGWKSQPSTSMPSSTAHLARPARDNSFSGIASHAQANRSQNSWVKQQASPQIPPYVDHSFRGHESSPQDSCATDSQTASTDIKREDDTSRKRSRSKDMHEAITEVRRRVPSITGQILGGDPIVNPIMSFQSSHAGLGSRHSPIVLDDSDDEGVAVREGCKPTKPFLQHELVVLDNSSNGESEGRRNGRITRSDQPALQPYPESDISIPADANDVRQLQRPALDSTYESQREQNPHQSSYGALPIRPQFSVGDAGDVLIVHPEDVGRAFTRQRYITMERWKELQSQKEVHSAAGQEIELGRRSGMIPHLELRQRRDSSIVEQLRARPHTTAPAGDSMQDLAVRAQLVKALLAEAPEPSQRVNPIQDAAPPDDHWQLDYGRGKLKGEQNQCKSDSSSRAASRHAASISAAKDPHGRKLPAMGAAVDRTFETQQVIEAARQGDIRPIPVGPRMTIKQVADPAGLGAGFEEIGRLVEQSQPTTGLKRAFKDLNFDDTTVKRLKSSTQITTGHTTQLTARGAGDPDDDDVSMDLEGSDEENDVQAMVLWQESRWTFAERHLSADADEGALILWTGKERSGPIPNMQAALDRFVVACRIPVGPLHQIVL